MTSKNKLLKSPKPQIMGILNVTPDSFSDGGLYLNPAVATEFAKQMARDGADLIDVGGESSRPGAEPVAEEVELERVVPVIESVASLEATLSVDTTKLAVAEAALQAGATVVNDISALRFAPEIAALCAESGAKVCLMHMQGTPATMQKSPSYDDVVCDVKDFLAERIEFALSEGLSQDQLLIDPGIGFGKTVEHNSSLILRLDEIAALGPPVVVGTSRKSFLTALAGDSVDRVAATVATNVVALTKGAEVFRVHDVAVNRSTLDLVAGLISQGLR